MSAVPQFWRIMRHYVRAHYYRCACLGFIFCNDFSPLHFCLSRSRVIVEHGRAWLIVNALLNCCIGVLCSVAVATKNVLQTIIALWVSCFHFDEASQGFRCYRLRFAYAHIAASAFYPAVAILQTSQNTTLGHQYVCSKTQASSFHSGPKPCSILV